MLQSTADPGDHFQATDQKPATSSAHNFNSPIQLSHYFKTILTIKDYGKLTGCARLQHGLLHA